MVLLDDEQGHEVSRIETIAEGVTLYLGDCREILPTLGKVDAVVTSPPYNTLQHDAKPSGMHADSGGALNFIKKMKTAYRDDKPEDEYQEWLRGIVGQCLDVSLGLVWVNHKVRFRGRVGLHPVRFLPFPIYSEVIWHRDGAIAFNSRRFAPSHESIFGFGAPHFWDDSENKLLTVWSIPSVKGQEHPCPFPVELVSPLVRSSCPKGGIILDPFTGSGTTGVAAIGLGRKFIGIEIEQKYFDIARRRLSEALKQGDLFVEKPKAAKQDAML
jgi:site-specific DNA-methyltransferase (adenine-specific)